MNTFFSTLLVASVAAQSCTSDGDCAPNYECNLSYSSCFQITCNPYTSYEDGNECFESKSMCSQIYGDLGACVACSSYYKCPEGYTCVGELPDYATCEKLTTTAM